MAVLSNTNPHLRQDESPRAELLSMSVDPHFVHVGRLRCTVEDGALMLLCCVVDHSLLFALLNVLVSTPQVCTDSLSFVQTPQVCQVCTEFCQDKS
jgi:hypothetical protein